MSDYRNDDHLDRVPPKTVQTERSGSSIFLIVAAVIALLAILWFAFSGGDSTTTAPPAPGAVEQTAPMTPDAGTTPAVPETTVTPEPGTTGSTTTAP